MQYVQSEESYGYDADGNLEFLNGSKVTSINDDNTGESVDVVAAGRCTLTLLINTPRCDLLHF